MKTNVKYLPILIGATLAILMGGWLNAVNGGPFLVENSSKTKNKLIDFIDNEYVDNINTDSIVNITVDNILSHLDPHSVYISPSEQTQVAESMKGDFVGIGFNFYMYKDSVAIIRPMRMVLRLKREYKQGIESYMLIEQNYLDVSYLVIAFF
jgi:carboxyl-terminal processing protease